MKRSKKAIITSTLLLVPIIPITTLLTSCKQQENLQQYNADFVASFSDVKEFMQVKDAQELKKLMLSPTTNEKEKPFLNRLCVPLGIAVKTYLSQSTNTNGQVINTQTEYNVKLENNKIIEANNSFYFSILMSKDSNNQNSLNTEKFTCAIKNINENNNNLFTNQLTSNEVVNVNEYQNNFGNIITLEEVPPSVQQTTIPVDIVGAKISADSEVVRNILTEKEKTYSLTTDLKADLEYLVKDIFMKNLKKWNVSFDFLYKFKAFGSVNIKEKTRSLVNAGFCIQFQNTTNQNRVFSFLGNDVQLNPNDILTIGVNCNDIKAEKILTVDANGNVCLNITNATIKYQKSGSNVITLEKQTLPPSTSYSLNLTLEGVGSNNTPFNEITQQKFEEIFNRNKNLFTEEEIKNSVEQQLQLEFKNKSKEAINNLKIIEAFAIPAIKTPEQYGKFDVDKNGIYTLNDLLCNLGEPLAELYNAQGLTNTGEILRNVFSNKPIYLAFHGLFPSLVNVLRNMNNVTVNDIVDFLEQSLTINGKPKTEQQFKEFFMNIASLKEVIKPLLQNGGSVSGAQIEAILDLVDTLKEPNQTLWEWLSKNFKKIINLAFIFAPEKISIKIFGFSLQIPLLNILKDLSNMSIEYNGKQSSLMFDVPLYNFFSRENIVVNNHVNYINQILGILKGVISSFLISSNNIVMSLGGTLLNQIVHLLAGAPTKFTTQSWSNSFKSFFIPKKLNNEVNVNKTILEIFENYNTLYNLFNFNWIDNQSVTEEKNNDLKFNKTLNFMVDLPDVVYDSHSSENTIVEKSIKGLNYNYYFSNAIFNLFVKKENNSSDVFWKLAYFKNTTGLEKIFATPPIPFEKSYLISNTPLAINESYFDNYEDQVYDDTKIIATSTKKQSFKFKLNKNELIETKDQNYFILKDQSYQRLLNELSKFNNNKTIDLNSLPLKPVVYISIDSKGKYFINLEFPTKLAHKYAKKTLIGAMKEYIELTDIISFEITVN